MGKRKTFIEKAIELQPFMTCNSSGDPDPNKRSASVKLAFHGRDAIEKAQALHDAIISDVKASEARKRQRGR